MRILKQQFEYEMVSSALHASYCSSTCMLKDLESTKWNMYV